MGRFAPSTTGPAHPGTLLAALLCWLDARSRSGRVLLRLEDLDPERCRPEFAEAMRRDLAWLGLDWDREVRQSEVGAAHERALDRLAEAERLYPCACSRSDVRAGGLRAPDGSLRYPGTCRSRRLPPGGWRSCAEPLRVRLPDGLLDLVDEGGEPLPRDPAAFGDPVVVRRDGAVAYHLASVADDAEAGVNRVVRGRDLAATTAAQVALQRLLGLPTPTYRHHLLLLEERGGKLAKFHGAVAAEALRAHYSAEALCGFLAKAAGLREDEGPVRPTDLVAGFDWARIARENRVVSVRENGLALGATQSAAPR